MANQAGRMLSSLIVQKLGENHPKTSELVGKYEALAANILFNGSPQDMTNFQNLLKDMQDEIKTAQ